SWLGILQTYGLPAESLLCPAANEPFPQNQPNIGFGSCFYAWTGKDTQIGTAIRHDAAQYRTGSYGYTRNLTFTGQFYADSRAAPVWPSGNVSNVPVFLDAVSPDVHPANFDTKPPEDLRWDSPQVTAPEHWRFLISRHGRRINACMADGSARAVPLEETYTLTWKQAWKPSTL